MNIEFRPIRENEDISVYKLFQSLPAEENGAENEAFGLTKSEFSEWCKRKVKNSVGLELPKNHVSSTLFILFLDNIPVGRVYVRHKLVPGVGHIGRYIAPEFRNKGYGSIMLIESLKKAKEIKLDKVLIVCKEHNCPGCKTIEKNGGVLEKIENGNKHYWVSL
ncbi:MAG TPA: GNAT family N-acetyltransferase [Alphaproteobacteria bacterium]|nr:GNAT family N-acetyltransferase [Alphaproteobacteria bacterium]